MNVRVSKSALEKALKILLEEAPEPPATGNPASTDPGPPPDPLAAAPQQAAAPSKKEEPAQEKTLIDKFKDKVKALENAAEESEVAVGNVKFVKRAGKWEISSAGDKGSIDKNTLLSLVSDAAQADVLEKIAADDKVAGRLGVTVRGDQFIEPTENAANFVKDASGYYRDRTPVPVQILAQYIFQEDEGEDTGAVRASLARAAGESLLVYRTDKLMYVIDPGKGDIYILSIADNVDNPLQATSNLLDQLDKEGRIASTGSTLKGFRRKTSVEQLLTSLQNLRKFLNPTGDGTPFDVRIRDFQFVGDLQKALSARRTLFSKFVDLFQADELEMSFVYSPWGPAFKRARVLGSRGGSGGAGALSGPDMDALKATGLFTEESLPKTVGGKYKPAVGDPPGLIDYSEKITDVSVSPAGPRAGATVTGVTLLGNALTPPVVNQRADKYEDTYADAYFLFSNGALSYEAPPVDVPEAAVTETGPVDPLAATCAAPVGYPVSFEGMNDEGVLFEFGRTTYYKKLIDKWNAANYIDDVADAVKMLYEKNKAFYDADANKDKKIDLTIVATADQKGQDASNVTLSMSRCEQFIKDFTAKLDAKSPGLISRCNITKVGLGESLWTGLTDKEKEETRVYKRFVKAYWCSLAQDKATETIKAYLSEIDKQAAAKAAAEKSAPAKPAAPAPA